MNTFTTCIIDMGNVLVDFAPYHFASQVSSDPATIHRLSEAVFHSKIWLDLDQGLISEAQGEAEILAGLDEADRPLAKAILDNWHTWMPEREGMAELLNRLKVQGLKLYLGSNASVRYHRYLGRLESVKALDATYFSCDLKISKPDPAFFEAIRQAEGFNFTQTLFIDDSLANIRSAASLGMAVYHHNGNLELLEAYLKTLGLLP